MSRTIAQGLALALAATLGALLDAGQPRALAAVCFTGDPRVVIEVSSTAIRVTPMIAVMKPGATLVFLAKGIEEGQTVELDFNVVDVAGGKKGPFAFPAGKIRGRIVLTRANAEATVTFENDERFFDKAWKYEIVVRDAQGQDKVAQDPMIVGRGGL